MKYMQKIFCLLFSLILLALTACSQSDNSNSGSSNSDQKFSIEVSAGTEVTLADMTSISPLVPVDIYRPSGSEGAAHADLANFAWLEFIALVAPGDTSSRGIPLGSFIQSGLPQGEPLVWETFQHRMETFPFSPSGEAVAPQPWKSAPTYKAYHVVDGNNVEYSVPFNKFNNLDEASQIGQNLIFYPSDLSAIDPEKDSQLRFEAKVNQKEWEYVNNNYADNYAQGIDLPSNTMEVKASWRPISSIPVDQRYRYHIVEAITYNGEEGKAVASLEEYALIGLHIMHKTENYPTFIFATFEHTDILKDAEMNSTGLYYVPTYTDILYTLDDTVTVFGKDIVNNPNIDDTFNVLAPKAYPNGNPVDLPVGNISSIPSSTSFDYTTTSGGTAQGRIVPVYQPDTTNSDVDAVNDKVLTTMQMLDGFDESFIWQYYKLKGVQAVPTSDETVKDYYLANIVTESSQPGVQLFRGGAEQTPKSLLTNPRNQVNVIDPKQDGKGFSHGGCMGCHGIAQTQANEDFSFLFDAKNGRGFTPDPDGLYIVE